MLDFKIPGVNDRSWVAPILEKSGCIGADCAFGTMYIWQDAYNIKICRYKDFILKTIGKEDELSYSFPIGFGNTKEALEILMQDAKDRNIDFKMIGLAESAVEFLEKEMPGCFLFEERRDLADYIYNTEDLALLKGKKYHSKRNHISKFERSYPFKYENISENNIEDCRRFCDRWFKENKDQKDSSIDMEKIALEKTFNNFNDLGFLGGFIKSDDEIIALEIGEKINDDVFLVHFEKALLSYTGSYTMINREFSARELENYKFANREEDMGIEGLRKAKLSYHPSLLLKKFVAVQRG